MEVGGGEGPGQQGAQGQHPFQLGKEVAPALGRPGKLPLP